MREVIRTEPRIVEGRMHEASREYSAKAERLLSARGRLGVVNAAGNGSTMPSSQELSQLIEAVASRHDREAFAALFRHFGPRLKTFFMRGGMSAGIAEDLVQETMLSVWRKASYFDRSRAGAATWVFTVARNLRIDHLRRQRNPADLPADPEETPPSIEDAFLDAERDVRVRRALTGLTPEQQTIIRLSYYSEKSQTEIASDLGIPLGTVKSRVRLAMNRLRILLEDET
ncbi:sigma-70 family RNA polymerase sigma factor [Mesorhizobium sp. CAU 1741]|uniref:sigma-70 family RNA polymerase sigma factor n=1 Tax=Mesorhizobium sp. CAU 1741 TaxID=3140366 RepID=UPI00325A5BD3